MGPFPTLVAQAMSSENLGRACRESHLSEVLTYCLPWDRDQAPAYLCQFQFLLQPSRSLGRPVAACPGVDPRLREGMGEVERIQGASFCPSHPNRNPFQSGGVPMATLLGLSACIASLVSAVKEEAIAGLATIPPYLARPLKA